LLRLDPRTGAVVDRIALGEPSLQVAVGGGAVWVLAGHQLVKVDPSSNRVVARFPVCCVLGGVSSGSIWLGDLDAGTVLQVDAVSGRILAKIPVPDRDPCQIAATERAVWVMSCGPALTRLSWKVSRIDPTAGRIVWTRSLPIASHIAASGPNLWVASAANADPGIALRPMGLNGSWLRPAVLVRYFGHRFNAIGLSLGPPLGIAVGEGALWVSDFSGGEVIRAELEVVQPAASPSG
jgi:hypothetical protein